MKRSVAESVPNRASAHTRNAVFEAASAPEPFRCWKWNVPYWIGFWNGLSQVWTLLSEQKLQQNLVNVLANDLFKSKGSVANCMTDRALFTLGTLQNNLCTATEHKFLFTLYGSNFWNWYSVKAACVGNTHSAISTFNNDHLKINKTLKYQLF